MSAYSIDRPSGVSARNPGPARKRASYGSGETNPHCRKSVRQAGFSLLEVLVAFIILSLSLGVVMRLFSASLGNVGAAGQHAHAVAVAESALAGLGVEGPLAEGEIAGAGADDRGYRWQARVSRRDAAPPEAVTATRLYLIELDVIRDEEAEPLLTLTTLRLAAAP